MKVFTSIVRDIISPNKSQYYLEELGPKEFTIPYLYNETEQPIHIVRHDDSFINCEGFKIFNSVYINSSAPTNICVVVLHSSRGSQMEMLPNIK